MAKVNVVDSTQPNISGQQMMALAATVSAIGIRADSKRSFRRILRILEWISSDAQYRELERALRQENTAVAGRIHMQPQRLQALACAVTPWGAENFEKILSIVRFLGPCRWGIGFAVQVMKNGFRDSDEFDPGFIAWSNRTFVADHMGDTR